MVDAIMISSHKGDPLVFRLLRDKLPMHQIANQFRINVICAKTPPFPVVTLANLNYIHVHHEDVFLVGVMCGNGDVACMFEVLFRLIKTFESVVGKILNEVHLKNYAHYMYEIIDELLDHGLPQIVSQDVMLLPDRKKKTSILSSASSSSPAIRPNVTSDVTGLTPWRSSDIKYKKNEVYIDVIESVNMLVSAKGTLLRADVEGQIKVKALLSGMPDCKFGMNDKIVMENEQQGRRNKKAQGIQIDHCSFHQCVRLGKFGSDRQISFCPPDGEFELMHYRISENISLPFKLFPQIDEISSTKMDIHLRVRSDFSSTLMAYDVLVRIPTPLNTADSVIHVTSGRARYRAGNNAFLWRLKKISGTAEATFTAHVTMTPSQKEWSRPPIALQFRVPMFTSSGVKVRFLKVVEPHLRYTPVKWVRYVTNASTYQHRI